MKNLILQRVKNAIKKLDFASHQRFGLSLMKGLEELEIENLEKKLGVKFPTDYRDFLQITGKFLQNPRNPDCVINFPITESWGFINTEQIVELNSLVKRRVDSAINNKEFGSPVPPLYFEYNSKWIPVISCDYEEPKLFTPLSYLLVCDEASDKYGKLLRFPWVNYGTDGCSEYSGINECLDVFLKLSENNDLLFDPDNGFNTWDDTRGMWEWLTKGIVDKMQELCEGALSLDLLEGLSREEIEEFEKLLGVDLPDDYKGFLMIQGKVVNHPLYNEYVINLPHFGSYGFLNVEQVLYTRNQLLTEARFFQNETFVKAGFNEKWIPIASTMFRYRAAKDSDLLLLVCDPASEKFGQVVNLSNNLSTESKDLKTFVLKFYDGIEGGLVGYDIDYGFSFS